MDQSKSVWGEIYPLIRRRFLPLWLASVWPCILLAICMISYGLILRSRPAPGVQLSPMGLWDSMSGLMKFAAIIIFIGWIYLPRDLGAVGVAIIVKADRQGENLDLKSFVSRYARIIWLVVPLSIWLGTAILFGGALIVAGFILAIWTAFVMPALATAQDRLAVAMRLSLSFTAARVRPLIGVAVATGIAQIPTLMALFVPIVMTADGPHRLAGLLVGWGMFTVLTSLIFMTRSVALTLFYLDAVRSAEAARTPLLQ